jgi:hypothetical protein
MSQKATDNRKIDMPSGESDYFDLLEQAHLAYLRGEPAEARLALETILAAEPGNSDAADLLAKTIEKQESDSFRQNRIGSFLWTRNESSRNAGPCLFLGILFSVFGMMGAARAIKAGFAQGFGPQSTVAVDGRLGWEAVPVRFELLHCGIFVVLGVAFLSYFFWDISKRFRRNQ